MRYKSNHTIFNRKNSPNQTKKAEKQPWQCGVHAPPKVRFKNRHGYWWTRLSPLNKTLFLVFCINGSKLCRSKFEKSKFESLKLLKFQLRSIWFGSINYKNKTIIILNESSGVQGYQLQGLNRFWWGRKGFAGSFATILTRFRCFIPDKICTVGIVNLRWV